MLKKTAAVLCILLAASVVSAAGKKTVAVMNFKVYGDKSMKFLENALPESISTSLSEIKSVKIVERSQLGKVLNEIALEQTGVVDTGDVSRAGRIAKAEVLIIGSISGDQQNAVVTFKAVDVATGTVLDSKTIKAPVAQIFDKTAHAARAMGAAISGEGVGKISVFSNPEGADVYIDGMQTGTTPLVGYSVTKGKHEIKVVKEGYLEHEDSISVKEKGEDKVSVVLARNQVRDRTEIGFGVHYLHSTYKGIDGTPLYSAFVGHTFDSVLATFEAGSAYPDHNLHIPHLNSIISQRRWYDLYFAHVSVSYVPFPHWKYVLPYGGLSAGIIYAFDYRKNEAEEDDMELLYQRANLSLGAKLGMNILPYSRFSLFFEARFYYQPEQMGRYNYISNGVLGAMSRVRENIDFHFWSYGGGAKIFF